jgi:FkbM family methyltransferase
MKQPIRLSLSVITGNCERDVTRFLDAFKPYFDEVVMVRAVGSQTPDNTLYMAAERGCVIGEYKNTPDNDWPHVDNFAAARNASAALCTGDWIVWADMDDTAEGLEHLRELLEKMPPGHDILRCPYVVGEQGVVANYRERAWRNNGKHEWKNALHENLVRIDGKEAPQAQTDRVRIIHAPRTDRDCSQDRNLRILESIPDADRTHSHTFYLMTEYARRKDARAIELAQKFLAHPEGGKAERFETFMTLAAMAEDLSDKAAIYLQAFAEDPSRAEPLYELTALSLSCDQPQEALAYARHMMSCRWPDNPCWNHRRMFYGFFRDDLFLQALRVNGRVIESDTRRGNLMVQSGLPTISLLHATRNRHMQAIRARMEWLRLADHPERVEHIFAVDTDDEALEVYARFPSIYINRQNAGPVAAWNAAAETCKGDVLVQLSDDWKPTRGWDTAILEAIGDISKPAVLAVSDGHRKDDLLCMAILTRARYKEQGYLFHPEFWSMFSDNWLSYQAFADGVVIDARDRITFEHMHPAFGRGDTDATYERSNAPQHYKMGEATYNRLIAGTRVSSEVDGWCDYRDFYAAVAEALPDGAEIAEVGSWLGQSIIWLCQRIQDLGKRVTVHCVDTWRGEAGEAMHTEVIQAHGGSILAKFKENIQAAGVADMIRIHVGDSAESAAEFADGSLDFVFIDAAHDYDSVVKDLAAWHRKLKPDGIWAGHDYPHDDVARAVHEHAAANGYEIDEVGRCWLRKLETYAQASQDVIAWTYLKSIGVDKGRFVEIGALDGITYSNTYLLEKRGWEGVCIEPVPQSFDKLRANRKCHCVNAAVGNFSGRSKIHVPANPPSDDWFSISSATPDRERWPDVEWQEIEVEQRKFAACLPPDWDTVDYISIDAEGMDLSILQSIDLQKYRPKLIVIESGDHRDAIMDHCERNGYGLHYDNNQDLFMVPKL